LKFYIYYFIRLFCIANICKQSSRPVKLPLNIARPFCRPVLEHNFQHLVDPVRILLGERQDASIESIAKHQKPEMIRFEILPRALVNELVDKHGELVKNFGRFNVLWQHEATHGAQQQMQRFTVEKCILKSLPSWLIRLETSTCDFCSMSPDPAWCGWADTLFPHPMHGKRHPRWLCRPCSGNRTRKRAPHRSPHWNLCFQTFSSSDSQSDWMIWRSTLFWNLIL